MNNAYAGEACGAKAGGGENVAWANRVVWGYMYMHMNMHMYMYM